MKIALLVVALSLTACASAPPPASPADETVDGGISTCAKACDQRKHLGCLEPALESSCIPTCKKASAAKLYDPTCPAAATTLAQMRACGSVRCGLP